MEETKLYEDLAKHLNGGIMGVPTSPARDYQTFEHKILRTLAKGGF